MERVDQHRHVLKQILTEKAELFNRGTPSDIETVLTFDEKRDTYMLLRLGWTAQGRLFVPTLYARLQGGKIWIENDWTEEGLATNLLEYGIPAEDVVLAFHPPEVRPHTEFAVA